MFIGNQPLYQMTNRISRSISAENFKGEKGKGGMATEGDGAHCARELGQGWKISPCYTIKPGETFSLAEIEGPGVIRHIWIVDTSNLSRRLILRMYWDGSETPSVETPLCDFFAQADYREYAPMASAVVSLGPRSGFNCYWEMPFYKNCRMTLENIHTENITVFYQIDYTLEELPEGCGYFHAQFRRVNPLPYKEVYTILDNVHGKGQYVGTYMFWGTNSCGWWGEGEIKFYLDGDYNLPNPYEMVDDGTWTTDRFMEMASQVSLDMDGSGTFDQKDRYGVLIWDDSMMGVVNCTGVQCATVNDEGLLELSLYTEKTVDVLTRFLEFACQTNIVCAYQRLNWDDSLLVKMFSGDQSLFLMQLIQVVPKMREMDTDFGILPYFKYNEEQEGYHTAMGSWHSVFFCIPNGSQDMTRVGIVTEFLASEGLYDLTEAYYDKTLKGKTTRDVESSAMLDLIFATRVYDLGWYFQFGIYNGLVMDMLRTYTNNFASQYKAMEKSANKLVDKTNKDYLKIKAQLDAAD